MITKGKKALLAALLFALLLIAFALGVISGMSSKKAANEPDIESYRNNSSYPNVEESIALTTHPMLHSNTIIIAEWASWLLQ